MVEGGKPNTIDFSNPHDLIVNSLGVSVSKHRLDEHFTLVWANDNYYKLIGYPKDEYENAFDNECDRFFARNPQDWEALVAQVHHAFETGANGYEYVSRMYNKSGKLMWVKIAATFLDEYDEGVQLSYTVMTDISDLMEAQQGLTEQRNRYRELAFVDPVTGGSNRTRFDMDARELLDASKPGAYAFVSLDLRKFKILNDMYGTENGDRMLGHVSRCIQGGLRDGELIGRIAADEFSILLEYESEEIASRRLESIAVTANRHNAYIDQPFYLACAAGICVVTQPDLEITVLRDRANVARKKAKERYEDRGCAAVFYSEQDRLDLVREKMMEDRMHDALAAGEFVAYFQPKVCLKNRHIVGAEALVRWNLPGEGIVPPSDFIPLFERNGFVVELDRFVFEEVCKVLREWMDRGIDPIVISVNMSRVHLGDSAFLDRFDKIRRAYGVPAKFIEFEITETTVYEDLEALGAVVDMIHAAGYRCSMDDFGSGYSSLNTLKEIDVDVLKLDRAFFTGDSASEKRRWAVISSVADLAKSLEMATVAEGIETDDQVALLEETSCDMVQGYVFYRPVPLLDFKDLVGSLR